MNQYTTSQIQKQISSLLKELPFEIIVRGEVVAKVVQADEPSQATKDYIAFLEGRVAELEKPSVVYGEPLRNTPISQLGSMNKAMAAALEKEKYLPRKCEYRLGCSNLSVALSENGYWNGDDWLSKPAHLCQKHIDFVKKDKESNS